MTSLMRDTQNKLKGSKIGAGFRPRVSSALSVTNS